MTNDFTFPEFTPISDSLIDELLDRPETLKAIAEAMVRYHVGCSAYTADELKQCEGAAQIAIDTIKRIHQQSLDCEVCGEGHGDDVPLECATGDGQ